MHWLFIVIPQITSKDSSLKQKIFIITQFLRSRKQELSSGSAEWFWLSDSHEVVVKMLARAAVICQWDRDVGTEDLLP